MFVAIFYFVCRDFAAIHSHGKAVELTLHSLAFDVNVVMKEKQSNTDKGYLFMIVLFGRLYFPSERDDGLIFDIAKLVIGVPKRWLRRTNH